MTAADGIFGNGVGGSDERRGFVLVGLGGRPILRIVIVSIVFPAGEVFLSVLDLLTYMCFTA